jgi:hypothetical protein
MSFSNLRKQAVAEDRTVELVLNQLVGDPILVVRHLGASNKAFWDDVLARAGTSRLGTKKRLTPADVQAAREENREIVAKHAVVGVRNLVHDDGSPATAADVPDVIASLPDDVFDLVLRFVSDADNFRERVAADPKAIAGK